MTSCNPYFCALWLQVARLSTLIQTFKMVRCAWIIFFFTVALSVHAQREKQQRQQSQIDFVRERTLINDHWRFFLYADNETPDSLRYDDRPEVTDARDDKSADEKPTLADHAGAGKNILKSWILPTGNAFLINTAKHYKRPDGNPGEDFPFVQRSFDDRAWKEVALPHDWAINGPFLQGPGAAVGGGMGRLPSPGVAWYRKKIFLSEDDGGKRIMLEIDGAMSYAMVWVNGKLAGGWPYGYASWHLDITPYVVPGEDNQVAIRLDNPSHSARWYPGAGLYRNVWLTKTSPVHIDYHGTFISTPAVSAASASVDIEVAIVNKTASETSVQAVTEIYATDAAGRISGKVVATLNSSAVTIAANGRAKVTGSVLIKDPRRWGPPPEQKPNLYVAITTLKHRGRTTDRYKTTFGIRELTFDANRGVLVNGERIFIRGVNQHHDLGALGASFNTRAAERQLEILREMGCNAIRMAHNPPAPELLDLTDRMGFLVIDEIFDVWERKKTPLDFHLIFPDWHEQDLRAFIRRDRNHPSVFLWSFGNEVGEQYTDQQGASLATTLRDIVRDEDPTRPSSISMNYAKPDMPLPAVADVINLNYQGEGIRDAPEYAGLQGIRTAPLFPAFHQKFPDKVIISSENAAAVSSRGSYFFPVASGISAPVSDAAGGSAQQHQVSGYELYTVPFGSSADKVFASEDNHPFVAGGFAWSGWDYLGEPTPYYSSRSSYYGIIDLAGFKKDRFYLYQSRWRPDLPVAHIVPHWNWPERVGEVTPVHVFTSGDEAELFLNGKSLGRRRKEGGQYRIRWDDVAYEPGELRVVAYKSGKQWAVNSVKTTLAASGLIASADRTVIHSDGSDLSFITVRVTDHNGLTVPGSSNEIRFRIEGPGNIVATDNGDPTCFVPFNAVARPAFNGYCLVIVRSIAGQPGTIIVKAESSGLQGDAVKIASGKK